MWEKVAMGAKLGHDAIQPYDPHLAERFVDRLWADALRRSYESSSRVTGLPLSYVPQVAHAHVRSAAAWKLTRMDTAEWADRDWAQWNQVLDEALAVRNPGGPVGSRVNVVPLRDFWKDGGGHTLEGAAISQLPWIHYIADSRRLRVDAAHVDVDTRVALAEALARASPPQRGALKEAASDPDARVRWTAERLLALTAGRSGNHR